MNTETGFALVMLIAAMITGGILAGKKMDSLEAEVAHLKAQLHEAQKGAKK